MWLLQRSLSSPLPLCNPELAATLFQGLQGCLSQKESHTTKWRADSALQVNLVLRLLSFPRFAFCRCESSRNVIPWSLEDSFIIHPWTGFGFVDKPTLPGSYMIEQLVV